jgi:hypothetical protein
MDTLPSWLLKTIDCDRYGGRTMRTDEQTVVLYDCGTWTDAHTRAVRSKYPECDITVTQSQASLSGFIVVFKLRRDRSLYRWVSAWIALFLLVLFSVVQLFYVHLQSLICFYF